jgi:hypothetical protein
MWKCRESDRRISCKFYSDKECVALAVCTCKWKKRLNENDNIYVIDCPFYKSVYDV